MLSKCHQRRRQPPPSASTAAHCEGAGRAMRECRRRRVVEARPNQVGPPTLSHESHLYTHPPPPATTPPPRPRLDATTAPGQIGTMPPSHVVSARRGFNSVWIGVPGSPKWTNRMLQDATGRYRTLSRRRSAAQAAEARRSKRRRRRPEAAQPTPNPDPDRPDSRPRPRLPDPRPRPQVMYCHILPLARRDRHHPPVSLPCHSPPPTLSHVVSSREHDARCTISASSSESSCGANPSHVHTTRIADHAREWIS